jgi:hypothetical protein
MPHGAPATEAELFAGSSAVNLIIVTERENGPSGQATRPGTNPLEAHGSCISLFDPQRNASGLRTASEPIQHDPDSVAVIDTCGDTPSGPNGEYKIILVGVNLCESDACRQMR